jgi:hypothetical protein
VRRESGDEREERREKKRGERRGEYINSVRIKSTIDLDVKVGESLA